jgi:uncharacterized membrane protein
MNDKSEGKESDRTFFIIYGHTPYTMFVWGIILLLVAFYFMNMYITEPDETSLLMSFIMFIVSFVCFVVGHLIYTDKRRKERYTHGFASDKILLKIIVIFAVLFLIYYFIIISSTLYQTSASNFLYGVILFLIVGIISLIYIIREERKEDHHR